MRKQRADLDETPQLLVVRSKFGWIGAVGRGGALASLSFGFDTEQAAIARAAKPIGSMSFSRVARFKWCADLAPRLQAYLAGEWIGFDDVPLDFGDLTPFRRRVLELCRRIPFGQTISYAELAFRAGSPGAARAVGTAMASNRWPLIVPCHRVVSAGGSIGNYSGPQGVRMKQRLLDLEERAATLEHAAV